MNVSTLRGRRTLRAALGLFFACYCLAVRPAARAMSETASKNAAASTSTANLDAPRTRGSSAALAGAASFDSSRDQRLAPASSRQRHHLRRDIVLSTFAASSELSLLAPPPASGSAAPLLRDAGVSPYPPSVLS